MTKFDHRINLPYVFSHNDLSILPVTRGDYIISHFDAYHELEQNNPEIIKLAAPDNIQSLDYNNISSEAIALNCAFAAGIISDFLEDDCIIPTVSGRMGTGDFAFTIDDRHDKLSRKLNVSVSNAQMEIDGAYEGNSFLAILEAKRELSEDFITRQIYYPFRVWQARITKPVRPVFFVYSNNIFSLYEYIFTDVNNYSSIELIRQKNYSVSDIHITKQDILRILERVKIVDEPEISFPQADKFSRVINLCELLNEHELYKSKQEITEQYAFDSRQADYYANAGRYLGLIDKNGKSLYSLSDNGKRILSMNYKNRQLAFCECILSHKIFHETLMLYFKTGQLPKTTSITEIMKHSGLHAVDSEETFKRRAGTIRSWLNWIADLIL
ncbi:MAG: hypothetical protein II917_11135 [Synergistaceae bacterium]|nr:hypothetical protein [Synergistaceae bacterium]